MSDAIHLVDIHAQNAEIRQEVDEALREVIDFGAFVLGPMAAAFEDEFSDYLGVAHTVACNSGTDALTQEALEAWDGFCGPGGN